MSVTETQANTENKCEHCGRVFVRANTLFKHLCEQKKRWIDKDKPASRIAFSSWKFYFKKYHPNKKVVDFKEFCNSNYYTAFWKFGNYCVMINAVNPDAYFQYLLLNKTPIDNWSSDREYNKYLVEHLRVEDHMDAVKRTIEFLLDVSTAENVQLRDVFTYVNHNKLCFMISSGRISPWVLFNSEAGVEFLSKLNSGQTEIIFEYIDPEKWNIKFKREPEKVEEVRQVLKRIPL